MAQPEKIETTAQPMFTATDLLNAVKVMAQEMKKPSDEDQQKKDEDKARLMQNQQNSIAEAKAHDQQKKANEDACSHMKGHPYQGKTRIVAPFHSDGLFHPICQQCHKEFKPFPAGNQTIPVGASFDDYAGVTPKLIESWGERHAQSKLVAVGA